MWSRLTNVTPTAKPDIYMKSNPRTRIWTRPQRRPFFLAPAEIPRWIDSRCAVKKQVGPYPPLWLSSITWACRAYTFHFPRLLFDYKAPKGSNSISLDDGSYIGGRPNWLHKHRERGGVGRDTLVTIHFMYSRVEARYVSRIYDTAQHLMATTWAENKKKRREWKGEKNRNPKRNCHSVSISCIIQAPRLYSDRHVKHG